MRRLRPRSFGRHARFNLAVVVTILVVSYVAVPQLAHWLTAVDGYNPSHYEPKDGDREDWLRQHDATRLPGLSSQSLVYLALFILVAIVWLPLMPGRGERRRAPPR
jgi:hypothetical protein